MDAPPVDEIVAGIRANLALLEAQRMQLDEQRAPLQRALDAFEAHIGSVPTRLAAVPASKPAKSRQRTRRKPGKRPGQPTVKQQIMALAGAEGSVTIERVMKAIGGGLATKMYPSNAKAHLEALAGSGKLKLVDERTGRYAHANAPVPLRAAASAA